jgi:hypothetical protein
MLFITVLAGIVPLNLYKTLPAYTNPSGWLLNHAVLANAHSLIDVTLEGMDMLARLLHSLNAIYPIEITLEGMVMLARLVHL